MSKKAMAEGAAAVCRAALQSPERIALYREKCRHVPDSPCLWWIGAIAGKGHGRFYLGKTGDGREVSIIAHRFAYALVYGFESLERAPLLSHSCDNPLCQNVAHLAPATASSNRAEWAIRRHVQLGPLRDRRGSRGRAAEFREAIRSGKELPPIDAQGVRPVDRDQEWLW